MCRVLNQVTSIVNLQFGEPRPATKSRRKKEEGRRKKFPDSLAFRIVWNSKHNFSSSMMRRGLLLRGDRFPQRQNLRHDWLDLLASISARSFESGRLTWRLSVNVGVNV